MGYVLAAYALVGLALGLYGVRLARERRGLLRELEGDVGSTRTPAPQGSD